MNSEQQWRANQKETKDIDNLPELFASVHWLDAQGRWLEERKGMDNVGEGSLSFAAEYGGERKIASAGPELRIDLVGQPYPRNRCRWVRAINFWADEGLRFLAKGLPVLLDAGTWENRISSTVLEKLGSTMIIRDYEEACSPMNGAPVEGYGTVKLRWPLRDNSVATDFLVVDDCLFGAVLGLKTLTEQGLVDFDSFPVCTLSSSQTDEITMNAKRTIALVDWHRSMINNGYKWDAANQGYASKSQPHQMSGIGGCENPESYDSVTKDRKQTGMKGTEQTSPPTDSSSDGNSNTKYGEQEQMKVKNVALNRFFTTPATLGEGYMDAENIADDVRTLEKIENSAKLIKAGKNDAIDNTNIERRDSHEEDKMHNTIQELRTTRGGGMSRILRIIHKDITRSTRLLRISRTVFLASLSRVGLREKDVPLNCQRIRWRNSLGQELYDDYEEHEAGAAQALREYLNVSAYQSRPTSERGQEPDAASVRSIPSPASSSTFVETGSAETPRSADQARDRALGSIHTYQGLGYIGPRAASIHILRLLCCVEKGRYGINLYQELVTHVTDDQQLFRLLRQIYRENKGDLKLRLSLRTVSRIQLVKLAYGGPQYVDVRRHEDICEHGKLCNCVPPSGRVRPKGTEYECHPIPSPLSPPVGPRLMMDFFKNPAGIQQGASFVTQQLPKRTYGELQPQSPELTEAWGIYYQEGWDWFKIWGILAIGFFPPSLLFGILWGVLKKDIQGAFGVASWWMTGATILLGVVGTCTWTL